MESFPLDSGLAGLVATQEVWGQGADAFRAGNGGTKRCSCPFPTRPVIGIDGWVLAFTLAVAMGTGLVFGLAPALHATRLYLPASLKEDGFTTASRRRHRLQRLANRMEMLELELQLAIDASTVDFERNAALPLVTLDYTYSTNGLD